MVEKNENAHEADDNVINYLDECVTGAIRGNNISLGLLSQLADDLEDQERDEIKRQVTYASIETAALANKAIFDLGVEEAEKRQLMENIRKQMLDIAQMMLKKTPVVDQIEE